jgi:hypothetical protein
VYVILVIGVPLLTSSDFIAMGRYVLMTFLRSFLETLRG